MLVSLAAFKNEIKALPAFTGVADGDIRIVFTDCNKCVGYDTAKTNTKANAFAKLSATSAANPYAIRLSTALAATIIILSFTFTQEHYPCPCVLRVSRSSPKQYRSLRKKNSSQVFPIIFEW